jgi:hypothetical protein
MSRLIRNLYFCKSFKWLSSLLLTHC